MTDAGGEDQTASGAWEPDPTGRYKLRWRNDAGDWRLFAFEVGVEVVGVRG